MLLPDEADAARAERLDVRRQRRSQPGVGGSGHQPPCRALLDEVLRQRGLVAPVLAELGVRDPVLLLAVDDVFSGIVRLFCGDQAWEALYGRDDIPPAQTDRAGLAARYGLEFTPDVIERADRMADGLLAAADAVLSEAGRR
jgi:hypothetical protein